jgi:hypothetical protein
MPAVTSDLDHVLIGCIAAVVAAIRFIALRRTTAHFMLAFSIVGHFIFPPVFR